MTKKTLFALLVIFCANYQNSSGTAQAPDRIKLNGENMALLCTPLESFHELADSLNLNLKYFPPCASDSGEILFDTGNWRGYVATWEIDNDTLYLLAIENWHCAQRADLHQVFGDSVINNRVKAFWYTGDLLIGKGKIKNYIHMGFMSTYEKEMVIGIEKGEVLNIAEYEPRNDDPPRGFQRVMTLNLTADIPKKFISCREATSDTICFKDKKGEFNIYGCTEHKYDVRLEGNNRKLYVAKMVDSCSQALSRTAIFNPPVFEKQRYGYVGWADGTALDNSGMVRVLVMSNLHSRLFVTIIYMGQDKNDFLKISDVFSHSLVLTEFGY